MSVHVVTNYVINVVYLMLINLDSQILTFLNTYAIKKVLTTKIGFVEHVIVT